MAKVLALALFVLALAAAPAHAWSNPLLMSQSGESASDHAVGIDGKGKAIVVTRGANDVIRVATRAADETTSEPLRINRGHGQQPEIATNAAGLSAIAWIGTDDGPDDRVHLRLRRPDGSYTVERSSRPPGRTPRAPWSGSTPPATHS